MNVFINSIVYFKSCSESLISSLEAIGFNRKKMGEFQYISQCQSTVSEAYDIPFSSITPAVMSRVFSLPPSNLIREWVFVFDFGHVFLIRTEQSRQLDHKVLKRVETSCMDSAKNVRATLCRTNMSARCRSYRTTPLRPVIVGKPSIEGILAGILRTPWRELSLPGKLKWILYKNGQYLQSTKWKEYHKTALSIILLANTLRHLTKVMCTDIQSVLVNNDIVLDSFTKEFVKIYFWTNPDFLQREAGVFIYMKPWVRKIIVFRLRLGSDKSCDFSEVADKLYSLDFQQFTELVERTKSCDLSSIQSWRKTINPFRLENTDLVSVYDNLTDPQKSILNLIYMDLRNRIRKGELIGTQVMEKYYTVNEIANKLNIGGRGHDKLRTELLRLKKKGFIVIKSPDEVKNKRARVKAYYFLNPNFPYHHYLLELFYSLWSREDVKSKDSNRVGT